MDAWPVFPMYANRCIAGADLGQLDQAIKDCSKAIELNPKWAQPYYGRGAAFRAQGLKSQAIADLEKYLQLAPPAFDRDRTQAASWLGELKGQ